jgi:hypothetical protein
MQAERSAWNRWPMMPRKDLRGETEDAGSVEANGGMLGGMVVWNASILAGNSRDLCLRQQDKSH